MIVKSYSRNLHKASPPYYNCGASFNDVPRQWARYFRKKAGHPASPEVAALSDVLGKLKEQVDTFLVPYGTLEMAHVTVPHFPAIYVEDLLDAAEHANFQLLTMPNYRPGDQAQWPINELNSAMAGNNIGRTDSPEDNDNTFFVLYTRTALAAYVGPFWVSTHYYAASGVANFSIGFSECSKQPDSQAEDCPPEAPYWQEVRVNLRAALASYYLGRNLGRVIVWGESSRNEVFADVLRQEVLAAQEREDNLPRLYDDFPIFSPARGAAGFGKVCASSNISFACIPDIRPRMQGW